MVKTHAQTMRPATPHRTEEKEVVLPTPMMAPILGLALGFTRLMMARNFSQLLPLTHRIILACNATITPGDPISPLFKIL